MHGAVRRPGLRSGSSLALQQGNCWHAFSCQSVALLRTRLPWQPALTRRGSWQPLTYEVVHASNDCRLTKTRESCSPMNWILSWSAEIEIALHHCYFSWRDVHWQESNLVVALGVAACWLWNLFWVFLWFSRASIFFAAWNIKNNNRNSFWNSHA